MKHQKSQAPDGGIKITLSLKELNVQEISVFCTKCRLIGNPQRLFILAALDYAQELPYDAIKYSTDLSSSLLTQYLKQLTDGGLVEIRTKNKIKYYRLAPNRWMNLHHH